MSSLQSIMNLDEDQHDASKPTSMDKKDKDPATPASGFRGQDPSSSSTPLGHVIRSRQQPSPTYTTTPSSTVIAEDSHVTLSGQQPTGEGLGSRAAVQKGKRRAGASDPRTRTSGAATITTTTTTPTTSSHPTGSRRQSTTSVDSMEQYGYGSASSSSLGGAGGGGLPPNIPTRPMGSPNPEVPIRLTPITGRVSRAKKGVPVHTCDMCNPPKTFTRAEHLRRHQLSHQTPRFPCTYPGCDRAFHRPDLLLRHQQRHEQEGDKASGSGGEASRRGSTASRASTNLEGGMSGLRAGGSLQPPPGFQSNTPGYGGPSTPSSTSDMPPTPNLPNASFQPGGSPAPGGAGAAMSPQMGDRFNTSSGPGSTNSYGNATYTFQPGISIINPAGSLSSSPEPPPYSQSDYMTPRTVPLFVTTQNLSQPATVQPSLDDTPGLGTDYSPWNSDSNYSTPPSDITRPRHYWGQQRPHNSLDYTNMLHAFPTSAQREIHGTNDNLDTVAAPHYVTSHFPMSPHLAPAPYQAYGPILDASIMTGFPDDQMLDPSITASHAVHHRSSSVRSPTPPPSSAQAADTLVTPAPLSNRIDPMAQVSRQKEMVMGGGNVAADVVMICGSGSSPSWGSNSPGGVLTGSALASAGGCGIGGMTVVTPLARSVRNAVPHYLELYWERFHTLWPFIHRPTVEGRGEEVLRCVLAAIATQFSNSKEDRIRGNQLHEYAWQEAKRYPPWNLQAMQALLMCEYFARFRGRKAVVRPSKQFESLYSRVLDQNPAMYATALGHSNLGLQMNNEERWQTWVDGETRRRVLCLSFILDSHTSILHQQPRARTDIDPSTIALTGPSDILWAANSADEWAELLAANPAAGTPQYLPHLNTLTPEEVAQHSIIDQVLILHAEALRLPRRHAGRSSNDKNDDLESNSPDDLRTPTTASFGQNFRGVKPEDRIAYLFSGAAKNVLANTYMALHYTPLHDLLAVSGDSYVFCQKVLNGSAFAEHQKRLKSWAEGRTSSTSPTSPQGTSSASLEGLSAAKATQHAARALIGLLDRGPDDSNGITPYIACLSDYWAMYVCALVVWASGHRTGRPSSMISASASGGGGGGSGGNSNNSPSKGGAMGEDDAVAWLRAVAETDQPEQAARTRGRREASAGVVSLVKRRLEADCVGPRSQLYVDAVSVLKKLGDGVNRRWF